MFFQFGEMSGNRLLILNVLLRSTKRIILSSIPSSPFDDIRPYCDAEVKPALRRLLADDAFVKTILKLRKRPPGKLYTAIATPFVRLYLKWKFSSIHTVDDVQKIVKDYLDKMLETTVDQFTISGLEKLSAGCPYLFLGNHRDIVLDPALINYALVTNGHPTVRIAIGDNLQSHEFISDLMKLNKSFIVKRSVKKPRERVEVLQKLSAYISHSIKKDRESIWIAQNEGRAKDGRDVTHPAIIKMIAMSKPAEHSFSDYINSLNIVPVAISYEYDPCDLAKARELQIRKEEGHYTKEKDEDFRSIMRGINGYKGSIHISFGQPVIGHFANAQELSDHIDQQMAALYHLHPSYISAAKLLGISYEDLKVNEPSPEQASYFNKRIQSMPAAYQNNALEMYANMVSAKQQLAREELTQQSL